MAPKLRYIVGISTAVHVAVSEHLRRKRVSEIEATLSHDVLYGPPTANERKLFSELQMTALRLLPYRIGSRLWGAIHDLPLPEVARVPMYKAWTIAFGCNLDEMKNPLESYANLAEFFGRELKDGSRPIARDGVSVTSPVDGKVMSVGVADLKSKVPILEQVKGVRYRLDTFLGDLPTLHPNSKLCYAVLYLAPGDYHRIHAPADWSVDERRHFPGTLFPVAKFSVSRVPELFNLNERVALLGSWKYGFYSMTAVGATNVGSIRLSGEPDFVSNKSGQGWKFFESLTKLYPAPQLFTRGDEMAQFRLGSTVVLVFEAPSSFEFNIQPNDTVRMGKPLGKCKGPSSSLQTTFPTAHAVLRRAQTKRSTIQPSSVQSSPMPQNVRIDQDKFNKLVKSLGKGYQ